MQLQLTTYVRELQTVFQGIQCSIPKQIKFTAQIKARRTNLSSQIMQLELIVYIRNRQAAFEDTQCSIQKNKLTDLHYLETN